MTDSFNMIDLFKIIFKWRKHLMILGLLAAIGSSVVALMLPVYYKSTASFYASNPALMDRQTLFNTQGGAESRIEYFGAKKDIDRALSLAQSASLAGYIINKFDLYDHYKIDTNTTQYYMTQVNKEFADNYIPMKTDLGGIEITVFDTKPQMAADIANEIVEKVDDMNKKMIMENKKKIIGMFKNKLTEKEGSVNELSDRMASMRQNLNTVQDQEQFNLLEKRLASMIEELNLLSSLYDQHAASTSDDISTIYRADVAYAAEKKSKPIRWLIVVTATFLTLFIGTIFVVVLERYREIKPQLVDA
jgi:uncharacterized protein involved in exopolysaccharide biosynthesis